MKDTVTSSLTNWPDYELEGQNYIMLQGNVLSFPVESHFAASRMRFWNTFEPSLHEECETCIPCVDSGDNMTGAGKVFHSTFISIGMSIVVVLTL